MNKFKTFILLLVSFILQTSVFSKIDIFGANVNIFIPAIVVLSQFLGRKTGSISGLVLGLVEDFLLTPFFGVRALSYYLIGYIVGELKVPKVKSSGVLVTAISSLGSFLLISLIYFILGKPGADILNYLPLALITEILLNSLVYLIYNIIVKKIMYIPTYKI
ncbi:MAG: rod shape-determining protein MreD [Anaerococcus sp.]|uniref:rod shape-determining protein MreD n=1 Tax=Anaerococcus sp. TaxID=1872515 RepID=UPI002602D863|nr:rod shape-determining protein MreD [Anaerococcus sp.]MCI5972653.1 rod shape-determining protein MreD [Anaerococcus sp.]MDD6918599.1 rod shape-determining protein MreD [Peptoniphilaceae bacterium]MDY2928406.1 rod shape-determining protein MreD [Anaerococcus sp.]